MVFFLSDALARSPGVRSFEDVSEIKDRIRGSKNYRLDATHPSRAEVLLIFQTASQQTWIVATKARIYCILDDLKKPASAVQWSERMTEYLDANGRLIAKIGVRPYKERTGYVDLGSKHHDWLYSKHLFTVTPIDKQIEALLRKAFES